MSARVCSRSQNEGGKGDIIITSAGHCGICSTLLALNFVEWFRSISMLELLPIQPLLLGSVSPVGAVDVVAVRENWKCNAMDELRRQNGSEMRHTHTVTESDFFKSDACISTTHAHVSRPARHAHHQLCVEPSSSSSLSFSLEGGVNV